MVRKLHGYVSHPREGLISIQLLIPAGLKAYHTSLFWLSRISFCVASVCGFCVCEFIKEKFSMFLMVFDRKRAFSDAKSWGWRW